MTILLNAPDLRTAAREFGVSGNQAVEFYALAKREGFGPLVARLARPLLRMDPKGHSTFLSSVHRGDSAPTMAKRYGCTRQAIEDRIKRMGLWAAYKAACIRDRARRKGMWRLLAHPNFRRILPVAAALAARGHTVGCMPAFSKAKKRVTDAALMADGVRVRILRPTFCNNGRFKVELSDSTAAYVVVLPDGLCLYYPVPHPQGAVYLRAADDAGPTEFERRARPADTWTLDDYPDPWPEMPLEEPTEAEADGFQQHATQT